MLYVSYYTRLLLDYLSSPVVSGQDFLSINQSFDQCWLNAEVIKQHIFSCIWENQTPIAFCSYTNIYPLTQVHTYLLQQLSHWIVNLSFLHVCLPNQIACFLRTLDYSVSSFVSSMPKIDSGTWVPSLFS